jgi:hypothetical protein
VVTLASKVGHPVPGDDDAEQNRLAGLGALTGIATGIGNRVLAGLSRAILHPLPAPAKGVVTYATLAAMPSTAEGHLRG